jgi:rSAM/selenodomain-associated transferase 1
MCGRAVRRVDCVATFHRFAGTESGHRGDVSRSKTGRSLFRGRTALRVLGVAPAFCDVVAGWRHAFRKWLPGTAEGHRFFRQCIRKLVHGAAMEADQNVAGRTLSVRSLRKSLNVLEANGSGRMKLAHRILDPKRIEQISPENIRGCALAVMTKAPRTGHVKTRLVPPLTADEAAALNTCFLRDTAAAILEASGKNVQDIAVYTPIGAEETYIDLLPDNFQLVPQRGDGFGERLAAATEDLLRIGFQSVCLIDSDSPTVPSRVYSEAANMLSLRDDRVVLGPSDDGGYYLIGLKQDHRGLFEQIDWSTERVLEQTIQRAVEMDLEVKLLPIGYDVDDRTTLRRLCDELLNPNTTDQVAPETRRFLRELIEREGRDRIWPARK